MRATYFCPQYPVLSDVDGVVLKAYKVGRGMLGMIDVARITFIIDKKGIVRCV
jgi:peroxiredoxin Q/BCP